MNKKISILILQISYKNFINSNEEKSKRIQLNNLIQFKIDNYVFNLTMQYTFAKFNANNTFYLILN